jgi:hypothetical protein
MLFCLKPNLFDHILKVYIIIILFLKKMLKGRMG